jgi:hypothetical protein
MADRSPIRFLLQVGVAHFFQAQAHAGQRRLQVVRDRGQHLGALRDMLADARLHRIEGGAGLADLAGAFQLQRRWLMSLPRSLAACASCFSGRMVMRATR